MVLSYGADGEINLKKTEIDNKHIDNFTWFGESFNQESVNHGLMKDEARVQTEDLFSICKILLYLIYINITTVPQYNFDESVDSVFVMFMHNT